MDTANTINKFWNGKARRINLSEGAIIVRALLPAEIEQLHRIEAENQAEPTCALARWMPLVTAATLHTACWENARIGDQTPLDYMLSLEEQQSPATWEIIWSLYFLSGLTPPDEITNRIPWIKNA